MYAKISPPVFNQNLYVNNSTPQNTPAATLSAPITDIARFSTKQAINNKISFGNFWARSLRKSGEDAGEDAVNYFINLLTQLKEGTAKLDEPTRSALLTNINTASIKRQLNEPHLKRMREALGAEKNVIGADNDKKKAISEDNIRYLTEVLTSSEKVAAKP